MASCPTNPQPPDIEELCKQEKPRVQQRRRTMTLQDREPKHTTTMNNSNNSNNNVRGLPRSVSDMNVVAFCTCQQSRDFPFCDNTHSIFNKATNSNMAPLYVAFVEGECNDCSTKGKSKLSHSVDQTISHKRGSITQTHNNNKLHTSADVIATSCCCKPLSPNDTLAHTNTSQITEKQQSSTNISRSSSPNNETTTPIPTSSPSATIINKSTPTTPTNATIDETSSTTTTIDNDTCNTTKAYIPSSLKSPLNQNNIITRAEVAEHAAQNDLWMIIKGNVYDITDYVQYHPGGVRALVKFAGQDGTENVHYHSSRMLELLNSHYFIGKLPKHEGGGGGGCTIS